MNKKHKLAVLTPSLFSGTSVLLLGLAILAVAVLTYGSQSGFLYEYLFGANSSAELVSSSKGVLTTINDAVLGNSALNKILFFAFWMLVGLVVYIAIYAMSRSATTAAEDIKESLYTNIRHDDAVKSIAVRTAVRASVIILWIMYSVAFVKKLAPFCIELARQGGSSLTLLSGWLYVLSGLLVLSVCLHVHVIFLRFTMLRVRVFDSGAAVEE